MWALTNKRYGSVGKAKATERDKQLGIFCDARPRRELRLSNEVRHAEDVRQNTFGRRRRVSTPDISAAAKEPYEAGDLGVGHVHPPCRTPPVGTTEYSVVAVVVSDASEFRRYQLNRTVPTHLDERLLPSQFR